MISPSVEEQGRCDTASVELLLWYRVFTKKRAELHGIYLLTGEKDFILIWGDLRASSSFSLIWLYCITNCYIFVFIKPNTHPSKLIHMMMTLWNNHARIVWFSYGKSYDCHTIHRTGKFSEKGPWISINRE